MGWVTFLAVAEDFEINEQIRWTAGMVAQWSVSGSLRAQLRNRLLAEMDKEPFDLVCAHSLGSLVCYDTFRQNPEAIKNKFFLTCGSQIGNPCVRDTFAGRIETVDAKQWFHLYNPHDHVFTAEIQLAASNYVEVGTEFDIPNDALNHDPIWYFNNANTRSRVWREISGISPNASDTRSFKAFHTLNRKPQRRALIIGINDYPDPANRLEGCVNDAFLISSVLQECEFDPEDIRLVLDDRATADNILDRLHWLLDDVCPGDQRVLFYSGHGAQIPSYGSNDEVDHLNECLVPYDFDWTPERSITDKQFLQLYTQLPYDSHFVAVFDCCHSGGMTRDGGPRIRGLTPPDDIRHRALRWNASLQMWEDRPMESPNSTLAKSKNAVAYLGENRSTYRLGRAIPLRTLPNAEYDRQRKALDHHGPYLPIILQACQEDQFSFEYRHGATSYGAFTYSLAEVVRQQRRNRHNPSFKELSVLVTKRLQLLKYDQTPCLVGASKVVSQPLPWTLEKKLRHRKSRRKK